MKICEILKRKNKKRTERIRGIQPLLEALKATYLAGGLFIDLIFI